MDYRDRFKVIVHLADVHIGVRTLTPEEQKVQLKKGILEKIKDMAFLDGIVISGDLLDEKLSLDSEYSNIFLWFVSKLVKHCKKRDNRPFILICKGTKSHDEEQLENIRFYEDDDEIFFRIYDKLSDIEVDGLKIAMIPEEYVSDVNKYYKPLFKKKDNYYDLIFGHGMVTECAYIKQESENHSSKAPIFDSIDFDRLCKGPVCFGHIHTPTNLRNKFFYVGSSFRFCHGEEHPKGFNVILYIPETGDYYVEKIVNEYALNFNTLNINNNMVEDESVDYIVKYVNNFIDEHEVHKLSIKFKCIESESVMAKVQVLKKYFSTHKNIKTSFKIMTKKAYEKEIEKEQKKEMKSYLAPNLDITERVRLWMLDKKSLNVEPERIARFLKINKS